MKPVVYLLGLTYLSQILLLFLGCIYVANIVVHSKWKNISDSHAIGVVFLPFLWIFYVSADAYHVFSYCILHKWLVPELSLWNKFSREAISLIAIAITTSVLFKITQDRK